jgi:hypothetical protein
MNGKRLALILLGAAIVFGLLAALSNATAGAQAGAGPTYGGDSPDPERTPAWLRLRPGRRAIAALEIGWFAPKKRCSSGNPWGSIVYAGSWWYDPIRLTATGTFEKTVVDHWTGDDGRKVMERQIISGQVSSDVAQGTIRGRVKIRKRDDTVVRCQFGPTHWRLFN